MCWCCGTSTCCRLRPAKRVRISQDKVIIHLEGKHDSPLLLATADKVFQPVPHRSPKPRRSHLISSHPSLDSSSRHRVGKALESEEIHNSCCFSLRVAAF